VNVHDRSAANVIAFPPGTFSCRTILINSPSKALLAGDCCCCVILAELCTRTLICGQVGTRYAEDQGSGRGTETNPPSETCGDGQPSATTSR
jgi:hypothetical protein